MQTNSFGDTVLLTSLLIANTHKSPQTILELLPKVIDLGSNKCKYGYTALHYASNRNPESLRMILDLSLKVINLRRLNRQPNMDSLLYIMLVLESKSLG